MTQLADLIRARREHLHLSYAALSAAARDPESGFVFSSSWLHRLEQGKPVIPPQLPGLRALALALGVPLLRLQEAAAAQFFGLRPDTQRSAEALVIADRIDTLSPGQRDALLGFLDAFHTRG